MLFNLGSMCNVCAKTTTIRQRRHVVKIDAHILYRQKTIVHYHNFNLNISLYETKVRKGLQLIRTINMKLEQFESLFVNNQQENASY